MSSDATNTRRIDSTGVPAERTDPDPGAVTVPAAGTVPTGTWGARLRALGPGILAASAAIGGSHLVSSTQAGAIFEWQLLGLVVLANVAKYPFFRFGPQYTMASGHNLVEGYDRKGRAYLWVFLALSIVSGVISTAGVTILAAAILAYAVPASWGLGVPAMAAVVIVSTLVLLLAGKYKALDGLSKLIVVVMAIAVVLAVALAAFAGQQATPDAEAPNPWQWMHFGFLIALMGWMPAPVEISALNSMWVVAKQKESPAAQREVIFDFNVGYITSAVLALFFVALGALVQFGTGVQVETASGAYVAQLVQIFGTAIGAWAMPLITVIAFFAIYGSVITVVDGYSRCVAEGIGLLRGGHMTRRSLTGWTLTTALLALVIVVFMGDAMGPMLRFAMISAFLTAPVYAWLNFSLVRDRKDMPTWLRVLAWFGLVFLTGLALLFLLNLLGLVG